MCQIEYGFSNSLMADIIMSASIACIQRFVKTSGSRSVNHRGFSFNTNATTVVAWRTQST
jgi:hypothetical protein